MLVKEKYAQEYKGFTVEKAAENLYYVWEGNRIVYSAWEIEEAQRFCETFISGRI